VITIPSFTKSISLGPQLLIETPKITDGLWSRKITVYSDGIQHYYNVPVSMIIPENLIEIELYRYLDASLMKKITNDTAYDFQVVDSDGNGLNDIVKWVVPELSEVSFSVEGKLVKIETSNIVITTTQKIEEVKELNSNQLQWRKKIEETGVKVSIIKSKDSIILPLSKEKLKVTIEKDDIKVEFEDSEDVDWSKVVDVSKNVNMNKINRFLSSTPLKLKDFVWVETNGFLEEGKYKGRIILPSTYKNVFVCEGIKENPDCFFIQECGERPCYEEIDEKTYVLLNHFSGAGGLYSTLYYEGATVLVNGTVASGTTADLDADDNSYYEVEANTTSSSPPDYNTTVDALGGYMRFLFASDATDVYGNKGSVIDTQVGSPTPVTWNIPNPPASTWLNFGGNDGYDSSGDNTNVNSYSNPNGDWFAISVWFNASTISDTNNGQVLWGQGGTTNSLTVYVTDDLGQDEVFCTAVESSAIDYVHSPINVNQIYHLGCIYDFAGGSIQMYLNGTLVDTDSSLAIGTDLSRHTNDCAVANQDQNTEDHNGAQISDFWVGQIGDLVYWGVAQDDLVTGENFTTIYNNGMSSGEVISVLNITHNSSAITESISNVVQLNITLKFKSNVSETYYFDIYNWTDSNWYQMQTGSVGTTEVSWNWLNDSAASNFIESTDKVVQVRLRADGSSAFQSQEDLLEFNITYRDSIPPTWSNPNVNVTNPHRGESINISTVWQDSHNLSYAWLSTNETGAWKNYTDGTYESPRVLSGTGPATVNFTWTNQTGSPRVIGWRIYANDTAGNENGTNIPSGVYQGNFTMWGWSNITWSSPTGSANIGDTIKLVCFVNDTNATGSGSISGYDVKFYNETASSSSLLGTNYTNSTGHAVWYWNTSGLSAGNYYPKCNITHNSTLYYNASEYKQANTTISLSNIIEITLSQALIKGIMFGDITPNTIGNPARNNTSGPSSETEYNITVGTSSTNNIDFYVKLNQTFETGIYINETSSTTSSSSGFSTNTTIDDSWSILGNSTHNCTNIVKGNNCWMRLYFDVGSVPSGYKQRNYTICGVVTGNNPSICG
jgi:hypothetical protein